MNGARSIFMWKGYWLTALAAIVLLAASPGTASAQVTVTGPDEVLEGETIVYTVNVKGFVPVGGTESALTVTLVVTPTGKNDGEDGEAGDVSGNLGLMYTVEVPDGPEQADGVVPVVFNRSGTIRVPTTHDSDAEDENFTVGFTVNAGGIEDGDQTDLPNAPAEAPDELTIKDDEPQTYVFDVTTEDPKEGTDPIAVTLRADPAHADEDASIVLTLHSSDAKYTLSATTVTITAMTDQAGEGFTITPPAEDGNRDEDSVTVKAFTGTLGRPMERATETIKVADINELPLVEMMVVEEDGKEIDQQPASVKEGDSIYVVVTVVDKDDKTIEAAEDLKVELTPTGTANSADYTLVGSSDIEMDAKMSGVIKIEVRSDEDVGMESLMFDAVVSGESKNGPGTRPIPGVLSLNIEDATAKKITPKASDADYDALKAVIAAAGGDDGVNPGDTVTIMTSDLFDLMDGYTASYGVSVEGDSASASASGEAVTIKALMAGEAKITVTGTARMASSSLMPTQTVSNVAELTFPVMVVDTTLVVTLSADPIEVEAGGTTMITATANRYVTAGDGDVEIALAVVGDGMLDAESIMIAMGEMSGSAMLTANESLTVVATGSGISGLMQVKVTVTDPDAPDPDAPDPDAPDPDAPDPDAPDPDAPDPDAPDPDAPDPDAPDPDAPDPDAPDPDAPDPDAPDPDAPDPDAPDPDAPDPDAPEPVPTPALPLIAQWLLGLGLMGGGARQLFRRRRQG